VLFCCDFVPLRSSPSFEIMGEEEEDRLQQTANSIGVPFSSSIFTQSTLPLFIATKRGFVFQPPSPKLSHNIFPLFSATLCSNSKPSASAFPRYVAFIAKSRRACSGSKSSCCDNHFLKAPLFFSHIIRMGTEFAVMWRFLRMDAVRVAAGSSQ